MKAIFRHGDPVMIDHTPSSDVDAGDVVVIGNRPYVAHQDIPANQPGALASHGGVYDLVKDDSTGPDITDGQEVYWIVADELATNVAEDNIHFGPARGAAGTNETPVRALHLPHGIVTDEVS